MTKNDDFFFRPFIAIEAPIKPPPLFLLNCNYKPGPRDRQCRLSPLHPSLLHILSHFPPHRCPSYVLYTYSLVPDPSHQTPNTRRPLRYEHQQQAELSDARLGVGCERLMVSGK
jgi:hypothetical protein